MRVDAVDFEPLALAGGTGVPLRLASFDLPPLPLFLSLAFFLPLLGSFPSFAAALFFRFAAAAALRVARAAAFWARKCSINGVDLGSCSRTTHRSERESVNDEGRVVGNERKNRPGSAGVSFGSGGAVNAVSNAKKSGSAIVGFVVSHPSQNPLFSRLALVDRALPRIGFRRRGRHPLVGRELDDSLVDVPCDSSLGSAALEGPERKAVDVPALSLKVQPSYPLWNATKASGVLNVMYALE